MQSQSVYREQMTKSILDTRRLNHWEHGSVLTMMLSHQSTSFNKYSLNNRGCLASATPSEDLQTTENLGKTQTGVDSKFYNLET